MKSGRWALGLLLLAGGCGPSPAPDAFSNLQPGPVAPMGTEAVQRADRLLERQFEVETVFLTEDGKEIIAPGNRQGIIVDSATGKLAWAAWQCDNPSCPGRKSASLPLLFPWPNPFYFAQTDGTVGVRQPVTEAELQQAQEYAEVKCPACLKNRNRIAETPAMRQQYRSWCRQHVLPQAAQQREKLAEEYRQTLTGR